jgi:hypothetical protein
LQEQWSGDWWLDVCISKTINERGQFLLPVEHYDLLLVYSANKTVSRIIRERYNLPEIWILPGILAKLLLGAAAQKPFNSDLEH